MLLHALGYLIIIIKYSIFKEQFVPSSYVYIISKIFTVVKNFYIFLLVTSPAAALADTHPSCSRSGKSGMFRGDFSHYQVSQIKRNTVLK